MKHLHLIGICLATILATNTRAATFSAVPFPTDPGIEVMSRGLAREMLSRDLFGRPQDSVVLGRIDIYDGFPYLESRRFQIVSDPEWNRLLVGELGQSLQAFDGEDSEFGPLAEPSGLAVDATGRLFVADSGNDRVLVFDTVSEFDQLTLLPRYAITGLRRPLDIAHSDAGTPFAPDDDLLYVAETGGNTVVRYSLGPAGPERGPAIGGLGSGAGCLAGPLSIAVGREAGLNTNRIYVADAHNGRIVRLRDDGVGLVWEGEARHDLGPLSSLDCDGRGNIYAAAPQRGSVVKLTSTLDPLAEYGTGLTRPRSFHLPILNVHDHRSGERRRREQHSGVLVEEWGAASGLRLLALGVEIKDLAAHQDGDLTLDFTLTAGARVQASIRDPRTGRLIMRGGNTQLEAGRRRLRLTEEDCLLDWIDGEYELRLEAICDDDETRQTTLTSTLALGAGGPGLPDRLALLGNHPNPFNPSTEIRFTVPAGGPRALSLRIYDIEGRLVRDLAEGSIGPGEHALTWNGRNDRDTTVGSGIYFYRLRIADETFTRKMALVK